MEIHPLRKFEKTLQCKSDKSVTHRAVMFNAMLTGARATVENPLISEDTLSTVECMRRLGADIEVGGNEIRIINGGIRNNAELDCGNSGTTMRLLAGLLSGRVGKSFYLGGDASLSARPMKRVVEPLGRMGAKIECSGFPPLSISGAPLVGIDYEMPVKSAQVKSAILLAALNASGVTTVHESTKSRDHTEKMLAAMGADITVTDACVSIVGGAKLSPVNVRVCGDISSAAFLFALAAGMRGGRVTVKNVGINPTRTGIIDVLKAMGADVEIENRTDKVEPTADITVSGRVRKPVTVGGNIIPRLIDELPVIAVLTALCEGESVIKDAAELKVKESDRIAATVKLLKDLGVEAEQTDDGMRVFGKGYIEGGACADSMGDHRMAMAAAVAMSLSEKGGTLVGTQACAVSYPDFFEILTQ